MVSMMSAKEGILLNYGKPSLTSLTVYQLVSLNNSSLNNCLRMLIMFKDN